MIIIEGVDNAGKSVLANYIGDALGLHIQVSEGPSREPGEMNKRIRHYLDRPHLMLFDRFPAISNPLYDQATGRKPDVIDPTLIVELYARRPVIVYCDPLDRGMQGHRERAGVDTEEHLRQVHAGYEKLLLLYRAWAIRHALIVYRIGDSMARVSDIVRTASNLGRH